MMEKGKLTLKKIKIVKLENLTVIRGGEFNNTTVDNNGGGDQTDDSILFATFG